jgi:uncharacterized protein
MSIHLKNRPAWIQLLVFGGLAFLIASIGSLLGFVIVLSANHMSLSTLFSLQATDFGKPEYAAVTRGMLVVQFFGVFLLPSLVFAWLADDKPLVFAGLRKPDRLRFIPLGILVIVFAYLAVDWLAQINQDLIQNLAGKTAKAWIDKKESDVDDTLKNILRMHNLKELATGLLLVAVLPAIGEELFFRGILQRIFIQLFKSPLWGIIVTAAIFSAVHGQFLGFIPRMILGIILGFLYWYSGSLYPAMAGHFVFNGLQVLLIYLKVQDLNQEAQAPSRFLALTGILGLCLVIWLLNYFRKNSQTSYRLIYPELTQDSMHQIF